MRPTTHGYVAIEPDPNSVAVLRENGEGIEIIEAAIGSAPGSAQIKLGSRGWATQTERSDIGVRIMMVQEAIAVVKNGTSFIVKIDIEGFESDLVSQNLDWLDDTFAVYIEPHDWMRPRQHSSRTFQNAFGKRKFELLLIGEHLVYIQC